MIIARKNRTHHLSHLGGHIKFDFPSPTSHGFPMVFRTYRILWLPNSTGVLYTVGLGPCIGLAIEATSDTGASDGSGANGAVVALAHADSDTAVAEALEEMTREIQALAPGKVGKTVVEKCGKNGGKSGKNGGKMVDKYMGKDQKRCGKIIWLVVTGTMEF
jgi:hypothetical protein